LFALVRTCSEVPAWEKALAQVVYVLFFFLLLWMPVTGALTSSYLYPKSGIGQSCHA
jgi:cytochrome b561